MAGYFCLADYDFNQFTAFIKFIKSISDEKI